MPCRPVSIVAFPSDPYRIMGGLVTVETLTPAQAEALQLTPDEPWMLYTLAPAAGSEITLFESGPTDEGWSARRERVWFDSDEQCFRREWLDEGRDCDGRHSDGGELVSTGETNEYGRTVWAEEERWQRDHAAEAAGY